MNNIISVFSGIKPTPSGEVEWPEVLSRIQSDRYRPLIEKCRELVSNPAEYRKFKVNLPAVTFCGNFSKNRNCQNILAATGFIIPDLDHLPDVEKTFHLLSQDEYIWFCFRSPSGDGLKCALRSEGIKTDDDIKIFYNAVERYFSSTYGIKIDPACKDISRLTFVSYDPQLFINKSPAIFPIQSWAKQEEQRFYLPASSDNGWKSKYGLKVLDSACEKIRQSAKGEQHRERLKQSRLVGGFVASGFIDEAQALSALEQAVKDSGAKLVHQAMDTVMDGITYGKLKPLEPEERVYVKKKDDIEYYCDPEEAFGHDYDRDTRDDILEEINDVSNVSNVSNVHDVSGCQQMSAECQQNVSRGQILTNKISPQNLAGEIKEWITNSTGSFTVDQLDREFCLTTRTEKNNRSKVLARACACVLIKKHKNIIGKYEIIDHSLNTVDLKNVSIDPFEIKLPFGLNRYCVTPKKAIIIIAGSSNAGKTGIIMNIAKLNLSQNYKKMYLASEMGGGEILSRLTKFKDVSIDDWCEHLHIAERSHDFQSVVEAHNRDGLTLIDYLEEIDGEYNKITSQIRSVYDALGTGVAVIGIQKRTDSDIARGGQGTLEKSRMYVAVDSICVVDNQPICAIKIIKLKSWINKNLNYHELHFRLKHGAVIEPISDWMILKQGERERYKTIYENENPERKKEQMDNWAYTFKQKDGTYVGITEETFDQWQKTYSNLNLFEALEDISNTTLKGKSWLNNGKSWIFQITGKLANDNDKAGEK